MSILYLWQATQSEPGMSGALYVVTETEKAPDQPEAVEAHPGLVYQETLYDAWRLMGTVKGTLGGVSRFDEQIVRTTTGYRVTPDEIADRGWYSRTKTVSGQ